MIVQEFDTPFTVCMEVDQPVPPPVGKLEAMTGPFAALKKFLPAPPPNARLPAGHVTVTLPPVLLVTELDAVTTSYSLKPGGP